MQSIVGLGLVIPEVQNGADRQIAYVDPDKAKVALELNFITHSTNLSLGNHHGQSVDRTLSLRIAPTKFFNRF